jgi:hypothetical protein
MKPTITLNQAIVDTREELLRAESSLFDKVVFFKEATLKSLCDYLTNHDNIFSTCFFAVETNDIICLLERVRALKEKLSTLESVDCASCVEIV